MFCGVGVGPKKVKKSIDLNDLGVPFICFKGYWNNFSQFVAI